MSRRYRLQSRLAFTIVVILIFCLFLCVTDSTFSVFAMDTANSQRVLNIGDILLNNYSNRVDSKVFDEEVLDKLYKAISGKSNATIADIDFGTGDRITAEMIRSRNSTKDIVLTLDGREWTVACLSKDTDGNIVATLWQANAEDSSIFNP